MTTDPDLAAKVSGFHNARSTVRKTVTSNVMSVECPNSVRRRSDAKSGLRFGNEEPSSKSDVYYFGKILLWS